MASLYKLDVPHLIFKSHSTQEELDIVIPEKDKTILRELGKEIAEIGSLPIQQQRKTMWSRLNSLQEAKPMVWMIYSMIG